MDETAGAADECKSRRDYSINGELADRCSIDTGSNLDPGLDDELTRLVANNEKHKSPLGVYTVEDAMEEIGFGPFQIIVTAFAGLTWLTESMEVMLLSILSPIAKCEWDLAPWEQAMLSSVVFIGFFLGCLTWGFMTDAVGRRTILLIVNCVIFVFGLISAASPGYGWLLLFRFITGVGVGGSSQAVTYYVEFLPLRMRGVCVVLIEAWWAVGSILAALLALLVILNLPDPINWRLYLCLCAVPVGLVMVFFLFMPESARYYISKGQIEKGEKVIKRVAWFNGKKPPMGRLVSQEQKERLVKKADQGTTDNEPNANGGDVEIHQKEKVTSEKQTLNVQKDTPLSSLTSHHYEDIVQNENRLENLKAKLAAALKQFGRDILMLFRNKMWRTTIPLLFIWFGFAWLYYGAVLLTVTILEEGFDPRCGIANETVVGRCSNLTSSFYVKIMWTSAADFPGIIATLIIIELIGRKITMTVEFIGAGLFIGLLLICIPEAYLGAFLFGARGFAAGVSMTTFAYTPEVYPTQFRGSAMGLMNAAARAGALVTPFIAQILYHASDIFTISLYAGTCVVLAVLALLLPIETKGRSLKDVQDDQ